MRTGKHTIVLVDYAVCAPRQCAPDTGPCASPAACSHKVIKQIDFPREESDWVQAEAGD